MRRTVLFYKMPGGRCPIKKFIDSLPGKVAQKITWVLSLLEDLEFIPAKYFKKLTNSNIWECRVRFGSNAYRLFCFFVNGSVVVLTHGIIKKTRKIPKKEIERAEACRKDFLERMKK